MSNRTIGARYQGRQSPTGGGGSGVAGLINMFMEPGRTAKANEHEKAMQQMISDHETAMQENEAKLAKELAKNAHVIDIAKSRGLTVDEMSSEIAANATRNYKTEQDMKFKALNAPGTQETFNRGLQAQNLAPEVKNIKDLTTFTPTGAVTTQPYAKNLTDRMNVDRGSTESTGSAVEEQIPAQYDGKGRMIRPAQPFKYMPTKTSSPASVEPFQPSITPEELAAAKQLAPKQDPGNFNLTNPIPALDFSNMMNPSVNPGVTQPPPNPMVRQNPTAPQGPLGNNQMNFNGPDIMSLLNKFLDLTPTNKIGYYPGM